jgi:Holliday junction resolvase
MERVRTKGSIAKNNKARGKGYEAEVVAKAVEQGLTAVRAWGSDGRSLGCEANVDLLIEGIKGQAKRTARLAQYLKPDDNIEFQVFREDRGTSYVMLRLDTFLSWISKLKA